MKRLTLWLLYFAIAFPTSHYGFIAFGPEHQALAFLVIVTMNVITGRIILFYKGYRD